LRDQGYKVGIYTVNCPGLTVEDIDVSGNYQKHLLSTPQAEDGSDWLFPHNNDQEKWISQYGSGLAVESSDRATIRRVRARHGQNGIIIDRVNDSRIYDNDCSFLSGWGLAMWRSNRNTISRNAFDFCVRGYSHMVYNRGQDSAGILMFEQNCNNTIAENSVTHGGDGFFGFAGREALGEAPPSSPDFDYRRKGNNDNLLIGNDFSYAPAHGIEMTFSFGNKFMNNRMVENAICGVWGGYSQDTLISGNTFEGNGQMAYGSERGGINIEHGQRNRIIRNTFKNNRCGVFFWGGPNERFASMGWGKANNFESKDNVVAGNTFDGDQIVLQLRESKNCLFIENETTNVGKLIDAKAGSEPVEKGEYEYEFDVKYPVYGDTQPVGARKHLRGRDKIIMTEWGPYDYTGPLVFPTRISGGEKASLQVLGPSGSFEVTRVTGDVQVFPMHGSLPGKVTVQVPGPGLHPFNLTIKADGKTMTAAGSLLLAEWDVQFFKWDPAALDPRQHQDRWDKLITGQPVERRKLNVIDFKWGGGAPSEKVGPDHFGTVAETTLDLPAGKYTIWTVSDDGIRVTVDGKRVIDDWTWHPPKENTAPIDLVAGKHKIRIDHFEIDGVSQLQFRIEPVR
nr:right-handed parallel beta-helix repeat-containing protein [Phycisphaerae bacterium]